MGIQAFAQMGNTVAISVTNVASTPVQVSSLTLGGNQYRLINSGNVTVFLGYGAASANATTNAVIPTPGAGNSTFCLPLLAGTDEILSFVPNGYFSALTSSGTATIYITPGDGV
jgi:hypothetical protein